MARHHSFLRRMIVGDRHCLIRDLDIMLTEFSDQSDPDITAGTETVVQILRPNDRL